VADVFEMVLLETTGSVEVVIAGLISTAVVVVMTAVEIFVTEEAGSVTGASGGGTVVIAACPLVGSIVLYVPSER